MPGMDDIYLTSVSSIVPLARFLHLWNFCTGSCPNGGSLLTVVRITSPLSLSVECSSCTVLGDASNLTVHGLLAVWKRGREILVIVRP